ncbi:MBL fold metallo-hydrolase [Spiroplasma endosymbiont of Nebria brevicollis]|uniref:MBL fold metallo-hydrolase n=1 Tax=Spiroplasma endosymbiont of Nebria brevicollis TaxID=3066284 RepID=UPI00313C5921
MIKEFINPMINNQKSYLIINNQECVLIDASINIKEIINYLVTEKLQLKAVIITHGHWDHIIGLNTLISQYPQLTVYINQWDENFIYHHPHNKMLVDREQISEVTKTNINLVPIIDSTTLKLIGYEFLCQHIPGHTPGSQYILIKQLNAVFIGDTIFKDKIGYHGIPYCDDEYFKKSLIKLTKLDKEYQVYPGHWDSYTLKDVLQSNETLIKFIK